MAETTGRRRVRVESYRAKVFMNGGSQAVRLPKACRVATRDVKVHREGKRIVLEPIEVDRDERGWSHSFLEMIQGPPDSAFPDRPSQGKPERRAVRL
jgi:antitoxin VapB